ncbi:dual specificity protein phosphatase 19 [Macrosteles quadrilineatus]|uniref:dual specificity protein phosphatase 19 n=1 Tax=Macrosteles quadrilineatus TaxID=74068 RepID=UPI0023E0E486|nr:dual specificity protein phosphatase 19 [Macrosteles quadrilineatus]
MSFLESLQKKKDTLRSTETTVRTSAGDVYLEKKNKKGDSVLEKVDRGPGYVVDMKPDLQVAEVLPGLLMGSQDVAQDEELVKYHGITHILSVGVTVKDIPGVRHTYIEALDLPEFDMNIVFDECTRIINDEIKSKGVIYVHCNAGVSRSASVIIAYLMKTERIHYLTAYERLKMIRPCIKPNEGFITQLLLFDG